MPSARVHRWATTARARHISEGRRLHSAARLLLPLIPAPQAVVPDPVGQAVTSCWSRCVQKTDGGILVPSEYSNVFAAETAAILQTAGAAARPPETDH